MITQALQGLVALAVCAIVIFLVIWLLNIVGIVLPQVIVYLLIFIAVVILLIFLVRWVKPYAGGWLG